MAKLIEVMRAEPERVFLAKEAAQIMGCHPKYVSAGVKFAVANKAMYLKSFGSGIPLLLRGSPFPDGFNSIPSAGKPVKSSQTWKEGKEPKASNGWPTDPDDHRIGKVVPGWFPPVMRHVRGGQ